MADLALMYAEKAPSLQSKTFLAVMHGAFVGGACWILFHAGAAPLWRRIVLGTASTLYFLRVLVTSFVFVKRKMQWSEAITVAVWVGFIHTLFAELGVHVRASFGVLEGVAVALYLIGSFLNTGSEGLRHAWKKDPAHRGELYTEGLFRYSMHINYFGDLVLFTGWALLARSPWALLIPAVMFFGFRFANMPALDRYLAQHYGAAFDDYRVRTKRLIPFVY